MTEFDWMLFALFYYGLCVALIAPPVATSAYWFVPAYKWWDHVIGWILVPWFFPLLLLEDRLRSREWPKS